MDVTRPIPTPADRANFLRIGQRVIRREARALELLEAGLDGAFADAVETILAATGRVIVSGMGKSGHVGRKIAATLASTGTPAHFVHPAEASHGDLGMMARGDVALVLSNSGETAELKDLISYTRRYAIPLIGVASNRHSTLLRQADVALVLPRAPEACERGIVPTSSTTMTLALGDALAIALMEHRRFTPEHFRLFHPGGNLGARLAKVRDLMHGTDKLPLAHVGAPMGDVLLKMTEKGFGVAGIVDDDGHLVGIITDGDLRRNMKGLLDHVAGEVMTPNPRTISPDELAESALNLMNSCKITTLFAVEREEGESGNGSALRPVGILHVHDLLRAGVG